MSSVIHFVLGPLGLSSNESVWVGAIKIPLGFKNHYDLCWFSQQDCNMSTLLSTLFSITMHIEQFHLLILQPDLDSVMSFFFSFPCPPVLQGLSNDADLTSLWPNPWPKPHRDLRFSSKLPSYFPVVWVSYHTYSCFIYFLVTSGSPPLFWVFTRQICSLNSP